VEELVEQIVAVVVELEPVVAAIESAAAVVVVVVQVRMAIVMPDVVRVRRIVAVMIVAVMMVEPVELVAVVAAAEFQHFQLLVAMFVVWRLVLYRQFYAVVVPAVAAIVFVENVAVSRHRWAFSAFHLPMQVVEA
jgi:hypothetical protein